MAASVIDDEPAGHRQVRAVLGLQREFVVATNVDEDLPSPTHDVLIERRREVHVREVNGWVNLHHGRHYPKEERWDVAMHPHAEVLTREAVPKLPVEDRAFHAGARAADRDLALVLALLKVLRGHWVFGLLVTIVQRQLWRYGFIADKVIRVQFRGNTRGRQVARAVIRLLCLLDHGAFELQVHAPADVIVRAACADLPLFGHGDLEGIGRVCMIHVHTNANVA
mmetsp:Transcript_61981/g.171801  ORF Transcript_61981/g.171801 Transcript_61981/m.171801 type:complete len:224 (-) Transcript_61981:625-1296(-)